MLLRSVLKVRARVPNARKARFATGQPINKEASDLSAPKSEFIAELVSLIKSKAPEVSAQDLETLTKDSEELAQTLASLHEEGLTIKERLTAQSVLVGGFTTTRDPWVGPVYDIGTQEQKTAASEMVAGFKAAQPALLKEFPLVKPHVEGLNAVLKEAFADQNAPIRVAVTGAAGQLGYACIYRVASGALFGPKTPVILHLLELPGALNSLKGVEMELRDCAFPNLVDVVVTDKAEVAFEGVDYALLIGAQPRTKGMERGDLLLKNAEIFSAQGKALNRVAKKADTHVLVVGNPANTNALITSHFAPNIPVQNFSAMMRLDHNRALSQIAGQTGCSVTDISNFCVWGNHSATQYPDLSHALIRNQPALSLVQEEWITKSFIPSVQNRGKAIIDARGLSSAASAASAAIDAIKDLHYGTKGRWASAGVVSDGSYGITKGLFYGFPVVYDDERQWKVVQGLPISETSARLMKATEQELLEERNAIASLLK